MEGVVILQFCGLRSKCYSIVTQTEQKMAVAGVKKCSQKFLKHAHFVETLANQSFYTIQQKTIISKNHEVFTQKMLKTALSVLDIKRIVLPDGVNTIPYGYFNY